MSTKETYEGFEYEPYALAKYIEAAGLFSILLKSGGIVHFKPVNENEFRKWLLNHGIANLRKENQNNLD